MLAVKENPCCCSIQQIPQPLERENGYIAKKSSIGTFPDDEFKIRGASSFLSIQEAHSVLSKTFHREQQAPGKMASRLSQLWKGWMAANLCSKFAKLSKWEQLQLSGWQESPKGTRPPVVSRTRSNAKPRHLVRHYMKECLKEMVGLTTLSYQ